MILVKGVNKTVIEVNNTGSKFFEKIVFYVTPEYGNLSAKQLREAAHNISFNFENKTAVKPYISLRKRLNRKKKIKIFWFLGAGILVLGAIITLIL